MIYLNSTAARTPFCPASFLNMPELPDPRCVGRPAFIHRSDWGVVWKVVLPQQPPSFLLSFKKGCGIAFNPEKPHSAGRINRPK
jgi:hypothetical protein